MIQLINDAIATLDANFGGFDIYQPSIGHKDEILKVTLIDDLGRLQNARDLNKLTDLFKSIPASYFVDPILNAALNP